MASPEPGMGLGVFCVINGDENRCRPEAVRKFFIEEVGNCRIVTSSRSYSNEKTFVTMEFTSRQNAQYAMTKTGSKVNGCRISASPFRSRRQGNLIGQDGMIIGGGGGGYRGGFNQRGGGGFRGGFHQQRGGGGGFHPFVKRVKSYGEQESEKVRGMSPKTAARYIENRIKEKEDRFKKRSTKSYSRSRSRSRSASRSRSPSPYRQSYSDRSSDNDSRDRSRSRSPRKRRRHSRSKSRSNSPESYRERRHHSQSYDDSESEERRSQDRRRRHKKHKRRHHSVSSEHDDAPEDDDVSDAELVTDVADWAQEQIASAEVEVEEVTADAVVPSATPAAQAVTPATPQQQLPALPSTQLNLAIPSSLPLQVQQEALQKRHSMQQEFEADVSTISSVSEMLRRHDQSIGVQLRGALHSVVNEVTAKYSTEFDDFLKSVLPKST